MRKPRAEDRARRLMGIPVPEPVTSIAELLPQHQLVLNHWFENGCRSRREACLSVGIVGLNSASRIFHRPEVLREIERRRKRIDFRTDDVTEAWIIEQYRKLANANLGNLLEIQEDGSAWLDMTAATADDKAALSEYHVETYQELGDEDHPGHVVKKARIKFHDKKAALDSLSRIKGMFKDKLDVQIGVVTLSEKVQQRRERLVASRDTVIEGEIIP